MAFTRSYYFLFFAAACILSLFPFPSSAGNKLVKTPNDSEGPFYPLVRQQDEDNDLIHVAGREQAAKGDILFLSGKVIDEEDRPLDKAVIEIWQTDSYGRYNDQRDKSAGQRDPDFQYWGKAVTGRDGDFSFTTLVPGAYQPRPTHIHFKVWIDGTVQLTSQIYFRKANIQMDVVVEQPSTPNMQTINLHSKNAGEYEAFFQIVL